MCLCLLYILFSSLFFDGTKSLSTYSILLISVKEGKNDGINGKVKNVNKTTYITHTHTGV